MVKKKERKKKTMFLPTARKRASARTAVPGVIDPLRPTGAAFRYLMHGHQGPDLCQGRASLTVTFASSVLQREEEPDVMHPPRLAVLTDARCEAIKCPVDGHNTLAETA